jgi:hypothetical protein
MTEAMATTEDPTMVEVLSHAMHRSALVLAQARRLVGGLLVPWEQKPQPENPPPVGCVRDMVLQIRDHLSETQDCLAELERQFGTVARCELMPELPSMRPGAVMGIDRVPA